MAIGLLKTAATCVVRPIHHIIRLVQLAQSWRQAQYEGRAARGNTLLREWLSPKQKAQFDTIKSFDVVGCNTGKSYRIQCGVSANVVELDDAGRHHGLVLCPDGQSCAWRRNACSEDRVGSRRAPRISRCMTVPCGAVTFPVVDWAVRPKLRSGDLVRRGAARYVARGARRFGNISLRCGI
ncbi:hypothetical protein V1283_002374 [Bradyrhizobium sp. AZCC 2262]